ncbi:hypothetical protein EPN96_08380 [bacterium]|nr:MAG: hypothetical protein EPN96_08380 [bacterium]
MLRFRFAAVFVCALLIPAALSLAAINPLDPGLAVARAYGGKKLPNNAASSLCIDCHSYNPTAGYGSHFVAYIDPSSNKLRSTNSGGGWEKAAFGIRNEGEFFKISKWDSGCLGAGGVSKYADAATWRTVIFDTGSPLGSEVPGKKFESSKGAMAQAELICESCHSMLFSVPGTALLLSKITDGDDQTNPLEGKTSPLCVGCHGFLYQDNKANSVNPNWDDPRNECEITGNKRGNNEIHLASYKNYPQNHHVMTGDNIVNSLAEHGLLSRPVTVVASEMVRKPINTKNGPYLITPPLSPMKYPSEDGALNCMTCHTPGHWGELSIGATILIGEDLSDLEPGLGLNRISDGRGQGKFRDANFCQLCHTQ